MGKHGQCDFALPPPLRGHVKGEIFSGELYGGGGRVSHVLGTPFYKGQVQGTHTAPGKLQQQGERLTASLRRLSGSVFIPHDAARVMAGWGPKHVITFLSACGIRSQNGLQK